MNSHGYSYDSGVAGAPVLLVTGMVTVTILELNRHGYGYDSEGNRHGYSYDSGVAGAANYVQVAHETWGKSGFPG